MMFLVIRQDSLVDILSSLSFRACSNWYPVPHSIFTMVALPWDGLTHTECDVTESCDVCRCISKLVSIIASMQEERWKLKRFVFPVDFLLLSCPPPLLLASTSCLSLIKVCWLRLFFFPPSYFSWYPLFLQQILENQIKLVGDILKYSSYS